MPTNALSDLAGWKRAAQWALNPAFEARESFGRTYELALLRVSVISVTVPYVVGLVRQALEKQLEGGGESIRLPLGVNIRSRNTVGRNPNAPMQTRDRRNNPATPDDWITRMDRLRKIKTTCDTTEGGSGGAVIQIEGRDPVLVAVTEGGRNASTARAPFNAEPIIADTWRLSIISKPRSPNSVAMSNRQEGHSDRMRQ